jgi:hypothetical protein
MEGEFYEKIKKGGVPTIQFGRSPSAVAHDISLVFAESFYKVAMSKLPADMLPASQNTLAFLRQHMPRWAYQAKFGRPYHKPALVVSVPTTNSDAHPVGKGELVIPHNFTYRLASSHRASTPMSDVGSTLVVETERLVRQHRRTFGRSRSAVRIKQTTNPAVAPELRVPPRILPQHRRAYHFRRTGERVFKRQATLLEYRATLAPELSLIHI